jgi:RNA polymerase sigma-70 factor (ECF subfamily)
MSSTDLVLSEPPRPLPPTVQEHLGIELRVLYGAVASDPLPQHLVRLIRRLERSGLTIDPAMREELIAALPNLKAFAISLTHDQDRAEDLVQETFSKAWANIDRFEVGTNLHAWLFTILRNLFHSDHRKRKREVADPDGSYSERLVSVPEQPGHVALRDLQFALECLPADQRRALMLVACEGLPYEEVARMCGVAVGTIKSRVNRARSKLAEVLGVEADEEFGPDRLVRAATSVSLQ